MGANRESKVTVGKVFSTNTYGDFKYGIYYCRKINKFAPRTRQKDKEKNDRYIGVFDTESDAIEAYKFHKKEYIKFLADKFKDQIEDRVYEALCSWVV